MTGVILSPEVLLGFGEGCPEWRGREGGAVLTAVLLGKVARRCMRVARRPGAIWPAFPKTREVNIVDCGTDCSKQTTVEEQLTFMVVGFT